ncbi:unnamed protein product [Moneuplotes crassus]|uniref:Uncharacterized protein n=1 Tax=Euplotes crassus TaxID=5936 RepID=A0AAD1XTQ9_EUPCR|nr:unnamed protein product [Moneuplotes crassus]
MGSLFSNSQEASPQSSPEVKPQEQAEYKESIEVGNKEWKVDKQVSRGLLEVLNSQSQKFNDIRYEPSKFLGFNFFGNSAYFRLKVLHKMKYKADDINSLDIYQLCQRISFVNTLLNNLWGNKLKKIVLHTDHDANIDKKTNLNYYLNSFCKALNTPAKHVVIKHFDLSHKQFCRILASCNGKCHLEFDCCNLEVDNFSCLHNAKPSIEILQLVHCSFSRQGKVIKNSVLIEEIAFSSLHHSLSRIDVYQFGGKSSLMKIKPRQEYILNDVNICFY